MTIKVKLLGRRLAMAGALVMIIGLVAASAASASTKVPIWTSGGTHLPFGTETSFSASSIHGMNLKWNAGGIPIWIQCETLSASGTVEDYASGKPGTLNPTPGTPFKFKGCHVVEVGEQTAWSGTTCSVPSEIPLEINSGELTNTPYANGGLKLFNLYMTFQINGCPGGIFQNFEWKVVGVGGPTGNEGQGAWPGEVLFPEGTAVTLNSGYKGEIEFGLNIQGAGFTPIKIAEEEITEPNTPGHHYWYTGGGMRKGEGPRTLVTPGSPLAISGGSNTINLEASIAGVATKISCSGSGSTTGSVENPSGEKDGIASASFGFGGCTVVKPEKKSCAVEGGSISTVSLAGSLYGAAQWPPLQFKPASDPIATFNVTGCTLAALNGKYELKGSLFVSPYLNSEKPGMWAIPYGENHGKGFFTMRGQPASASGEVTAETSKGEAVTLH
jgi:hypothetical protein